MYACERTCLAGNDIGAEHITVQEGLFLYERGLDPYDGGIFHQVSGILVTMRKRGSRTLTWPQAPLLLPLFSLLPSSATWSGRLLSVSLFTVLDMLSADALYGIAASGAASASRLFKSPRASRAWQPASVTAV